MRAILATDQWYFKHTAKGRSHLGHILITFAGDSSVSILCNPSATLMNPKSLEKVKEGDPMRPCQNCVRAMSGLVSNNKLLGI